jgi:HK97 family phage prohead protease
MPYFIWNESPSCSGWAVVKEDGEVKSCHKDKQSAIEAMVGISVAEGIEPGGSYEPHTEEIHVEENEYRLESGPAAVIADIDGTLITFQSQRIDKTHDYLNSFEDTEIIIVTARLASDRAETEAELDSLDIDYDLLFMKPTEETDSTDWKKSVAEKLLETYNVMVAVDDNADIRRAYSDLGITAISPSQVPASTDDESEDEMGERAVNLTPPAYMRAAARQGLRYYEEGKAGDGVVERTIREARAMAEGNVTADKWVRIRAWISRHLVDLDSPAARPDSPDYPSPGVVAHLLWGSGPSKASARRALAYAEGVVSRMEQENEGRAKGEALSKIETRVFTNEFEVREDSEGMTLTGYAARFNEPSEPLPFIERIKPGAFKRSINSRNDIKLLWNHNTDMVLGSTRAGTLTLKEDEIGLRVMATLPDNSWGRDAKVSIQRGDVTGFSFGFTVPAGGDSWSSDGTERTLKSVRLLEVSTGVAFPAYPSTNGTAQVRGLDKVAERNNIDADALADALLKIEDGQSISKDEAEMVSRVISDLSPSEEVEQNQGDLGMLALKKKKLELLLKGI